MSEINKIEKVDIKNTQNNSVGKKSTDSAAFSSYLGETKSLDEIFDKAAKKYSVSVELLKAIGKAESNFKTNAVSRCGAQGVMQLMPATAKSLGVTDSFDAEQNIMGGSKYIAGLLKKYDGDTKLALAAYNAGSGNVAKYGGIPPFKETQNYVKKVTNYMQQGTDTNGAVVSTGFLDNTNTTRKATMTVEPTTQINSSYQLAKSTEGSFENLQRLDIVFSYDDYLKFIELFMKEEEEQKGDENKNNYSTNDITYNVPIMKLLRGHNLI